MDSATADLNRRFGGIDRLYGHQTLERFAKAHVCVVGVGGVGSWAVEALARSGIGRLSLIDADHIAESNINRQLQALGSTLGQAKVEALRSRILDINPACQVICQEEMLDAENLEHLIASDTDWLIDCIDNYRVKAALIIHCKRLKLPLICLGGAGGKTDPALIEVSDLSRTEQDPLLAKTRRLLRQAHGFSSNPKRRFGITAVYSTEPQMPSAKCQQDGSLNCAGFGSSMALTASFGLMAAALVLKKLSQAEPTQSQ